MYEVKPEDIRYVIMLHRENKPDLNVIRAHVRYLQELERAGQLVLSGPFSDYAGGMVIIRAESREAAEAIALRDPYVTNGISRYELRTWELSHEGNGHMGIAGMEDAADE
ncbi:YciI family protein [Paenibacillus sp. CN-4]|uniref:YciI family protein n=1 Tax=Paenibacillus nanchangensis TaxID=3348343 RepID=UPI00397BD52A